MSWLESSLERYSKLLKEQQNLDRSKAVCDQPSRLTPRVQKIFQLAHTEARLLNHTYVGAEHLLLGLLRLNQGASAEILANHGLDLAIARELVRQFNGFAYAKDVQHSTPLTPRAKRVIQRAERQAKDANHMLVGTEHLFIALIHEQDGLASKILSQFGVLQETPGVNLLVEDGASSFRFTIPAVDDHDKSVSLISKAGLPQREVVEEESQ